MSLEDEIRALSFEGFNFALVGHWELEVGRLERRPNRLMELQLGEAEGSFNFCFCLFECVFST